MDDFEGQSTGYKRVGEAIEVRPKVTFEHSFTVKAYDANSVTGNGRIATKSPSPAT
jgi:hypothetical protein